MIRWRQSTGLLLSALALAAPEPARAQAQEAVRPAAVAGQFYPAEAEHLRGAIAAFLARARTPTDRRPVAIVAPHAGYTFSGQIAADAWNQAAGHRFDTIVLLGANHTVPGFDRIGVHRGRGFETPLGIAPVDQRLAEALVAADADIVWHDAVHAREHSIEVHVPFVQHLFPDARILPVVVGTPDLERVRRFGRALAGVLAGQRALIVASSDLSHYPAVDDARRVDRETLEAIASLDPVRVQATLRGIERREIRALVTGACGEAPVLAALAAVRELGGRTGAVVSYATSADAPPGDPGRVVGYGAVVVTDVAGTTNWMDGPAVPDTSGALEVADRRALISIARDTIRQYAATRTAPLARDAPPRLMREQGVFVTLRRRGELRGCIGRVEPNGPLHWLVGLVALQAAFADPRFDPVRPGEIDRLELEIALLSPPRPIATPAEIRVGRDGVILAKEGKSAVFLPEVAVEEGWNRYALLDNLCLKAGLPDTCWRAGATLATFRTEVIRERDVR